jgi:hypothetical protein
LNYLRIEMSKIEVAAMPEDGKPVNEKSSPVDPIDHPS